MKRKEETWFTLFIPKSRASVFDEVWNWARFRIFPHDSVVYNIDWRDNAVIFHEVIDA